MTANVIKLKFPTPAKQCVDKTEGGYDSEYWEAEATIVEHACGDGNAYSAYLRKHNRRPTRAEAFGMGKIMNARVRADDGTMQPPFTKADKAYRKAVRERRKEFHHMYEHQFRVYQAVRMLIMQADAPEQVAASLGSTSIEITAYDAKKAAIWLATFARALESK